MKCEMILGRLCFGLAVLLCHCAHHGVVNAGKFRTKFFWTNLSFHWPNAIAEAVANQTGQYVAKNNVPLGLGRWGSKLFITVPRYMDGIAATLNYIDINCNEDSPKLQPYPSWEANLLPLDVLQQEETPPSNSDSCSNTNKPFELKDDSTLVSAMRVQVDACDRLWVLDSGLLEKPGKKPRKLVPSAILIFDLKTDKLVRRFNIPSEQTQEDSGLANIIVESDASNCEDAYAYIPDYGIPSLIVYSYRKDHSYRVKHNFFHVDPLQGDFNVHGIRFQWSSGLFGMAVGPTNPDSTNDIYFHSLASYKEYKVSNLVLQNETYVTSFAAYDDFKYLGERGTNGQSTVELYDKDTNVLFYTQVNRDAIGCWNLDKPYAAQTQGLVEANSNILPYPNDIKLDDDGNLWVLSNRLPTSLYSHIDPNNVNYIITVGNNRELVKDTPCEF